MPYLSILTNARVADASNSELLAAASRVDIPAQQAGELRDGEHRAGPAAGVRRQRGTGRLPGAEKHWFARCEARLTQHGVDRLDSRVLRYSQGSYLSGDG
jgi:hypothetical protein